MAPASVNRFIHAFPTHSGIGNTTVLHHHKTGLIIICCTVIIFSFILLFCSTKYVIFVWLLSCRKVFALVYVQSGKRKPAAGYYRLHRLLQFMRAVISPASAGCSTSPPEWDKSCTVHATAGTKSGIRITLVCENRTNSGLLLRFCVIAANPGTDSQHEIICSSDGIDFIAIPPVLLRAKLG